MQDKQVKQMKDILTGIGAALLISLCIVFVLGCSNQEDGYCWDGEVWVALNSTAGSYDPDNNIDEVIVIGADTYFITNYADYNTHFIVNLLRDGLRRRDDLREQEFRQNIADLQNRVYELERPIPKHLPDHIMDPDSGFAHPCE